MTGHLSVLKRKKGEGRGGWRKARRGKGRESLSFSSQSPLPFPLLSPPLWTYSMQATFLHIVDQNEVEADENTKKRKRPKCSHLERTSLVKKSIYYMCTFFTVIILFAGPTREIPSGQDVPSLPARMANLNTGFASSCPLVDSAM